MSIEFTQVIEMGKNSDCIKKKFEKTRKISPRGAYFSVFLCYYAYVKNFDPVTSESSALFDAQDAGTAVNRRHSSASGRFPLLPANQFQNPFAADLQEDFDFNYR